MQLQDVLPNEFFKIFTQQIRQKLKEVQVLDHRPYVDLQQIINIIYPNQITILDPIDHPRTRYELAINLGYKLQPSLKDIPLPSTTLLKYRKLAAEGFAKEILMPKAILVNLSTRYINKHQLNAKSLNQFDIDRITQYLADELFVPKPILKYRIKDVNLFI